MNNNQPIIGFQKFGLIFKNFGLIYDYCCLQEGFCLLFSTVGDTLVGLTNTHVNYIHNKSFPVVLISPSDGYIQCIKLTPHLYSAMCNIALSIWIYDIIIII